MLTTLSHLTSACFAIAHLRVYLLVLAAELGLAHSHLFAHESAIGQGSARGAHPAPHTAVWQGSFSELESLLPAARELAGMQLTVSLHLGSLPPAPSHLGFFTARALKVSVPKRQTGVETASFLSSGSRNQIEFCHSLLSSRHRTQNQAEAAEPHLLKGGVSKSLRGCAVNHHTSLLKAERLGNHEQGMCLLNKWIHSCTKLPS